MGVLCNCLLGALPWTPRDTIIPTCAEWELFSSHKLSDSTTTCDRPQIKKKKKERYPGCLPHLVSGMFYSVVANRRQPNLYNRGGQGKIIAATETWSEVDIAMYVSSAFLAPIQVAWVVELTVPSALPKTETNQIDTHRHPAPTLTTPLFMYLSTNSKLVLLVVNTPYIYIAQNTPNMITYIHSLPRKISARKICQHTWTNTLDTCLYTHLCTWCARWFAQVGTQI